MNLQCRFAKLSLLTSALNPKLIAAKKTSSLSLKPPGKGFQSTKRQEAVLGFSRGFEFRAKPDPDQPKSNDRKFSEGHLPKASWSLK